MGVSERSLRALPYSVEPADRQIAASVALLACLDSRAALRWYHMAPQALLLGSAQRPQAVDEAACRAAGVAVHRRRSGGGVVYASPTLLMLDMALPPHDPLYRHDVTESYRWFGEVWVAALARLGVAARTVSIAEARADAQSLDPLLKSVCYGGLSPYEVVVGSRKIVGIAQIRRATGALLQAGIYLDWEPTQTTALVAATPEERAALSAQLSQRVAGLDQLLPAAATYQAAISAFEGALAELTGMLPAPDEWTERERHEQQEALPRHAAFAIT